MGATPESNYLLCKNNLMTLCPIKNKMFQLSFSHISGPVVKKNKKYIIDLSTMLLI